MGGGVPKSPVKLIRLWVAVDMAKKIYEKMDNMLNGYDVRDTKDNRMQLLQEISDKHGPFVVLIALQRQITLCKQEHMHILLADMSAFTLASNKKMEAEGSPNAEAYWAGKEC